MIQKVIILVFAVVACHAEAPAPSQGVYCGEIPKNILTCTNLPSIFSIDVGNKCKDTSTECARMTCMLTQSGYLKDGKIDKQKALKYFDSFAAKHTAWSQAVNHLKAACLGDKTLPAQGIFIDCPAYDIIHCAFTSFIKNVPASEWSQSTECLQTRSYATACPVCPSECFTNQVPNDSCHACYSLPRSA